MASGVGRRFACLLFTCLLAWGCTGSDPVAIDEPTPATTAIKTATAEVPDSTVTAVPEPAELSTDDKIAAAMVAFDADPQPTDLIAHDHLSASVRGTTGLVDLTICGWTGETVFDEVYIVAYRVNTDTDGQANVTFESVNTTVNDDCINTELVNSAFAFISEYETWWRGVLNDPRSFDGATAATFWAEEVQAQASDLVATWVEGDLSYQNDYFDGSLPDSAAVEVLGRSYKIDAASDIEIFELVACRDIPPGFGLYSGGVRIDDFKGDAPTGNHAALTYELGRSGQRWNLLGSDERVWIDCAGFEDGWLATANSALKGPVPWQGLQS